MRRVRDVAAAAAVGLLVVTVAAGDPLAAGAGAPDVWAAVREIGFPAAAFVMLWLLMRAELRENTRALQELAHTIRELRGYLVRLGGDAR